MKTNKILNKINKSDYFVSKQQYSKYEYLIVLNEQILFNEFDESESIEETKIVGELFKITRTLNKRAKKILKKQIKKFMVEYTKDFDFDFEYQFKKGILDFVIIGELTEKQYDLVETLKSDFCYDFGLDCNIFYGYNSFVDDKKQFFNDNGVFISDEELFIVRKDLSAIENKKL